MAEHRARISWKLSDGDFLKGKYSREHTWALDGGMTVSASSSPSVVPTPWSNPANIDPEEAFVAAISSCHMLTFLYVASQRGFEIESYEDEAVGIVRKTPNGAPWISSVTLNPKIIYRGDKVPGPDNQERLHHAAHAGCYIANSVKTEIKVNQR